MQGSRGLLMGFGKAKLVAPPVRKFAPSIKIQSQNPAPVVVNESESERSLSTGALHYRCFYLERSSWLKT